MKKKFRSHTECRQKNQRSVNKSASYLKCSMKTEIFSEWFLQKPKPEKVQKILCIFKICIYCHTFFSWTFPFCGFFFLFCLHHIFFCYIIFNNNKKNLFLFFSIVVFVAEKFSPCYDSNSIFFIFGRCWKS